MGMHSHWTTYESPIGPLTLAGSDAGLSRIDFPGHAGPLAQERRDPSRFATAIARLDEYFAGERRRFHLALDLGGTPFQRAVWDELLAIPYGETRSYGELARAVGRTDRVRAVGAAVGRTPVPIVVPCHRAVGADGSLTGYRGGLQRKRTLLDLEDASGGGRPLPEVLLARQLTLAV